MPFRYPSAFCLVIGIGFLLQPCLAQQDTVQVQFVSFPVSSETEPVLLPTGDRDLIPVALPSNSISDTYRVERPRKWVLGKVVAGPDGKTKFDVYGEAPMLAAQKQLILVTRKGPNNADGFIMTPFPCNDDGFSGGKYLFFNASKVEVACELGRTTFAIKPQRHRLLAPEPSAEKNGREYLYTTLYYRLGENIRPFYTSTWRFNNQARSMVFIYHDIHTKQLRTHSIRTFL